MQSGAGYGTATIGDYRTIQVLYNGEVCNEYSIKSTQANQTVYEVEMLADGSAKVYTRDYGSADFTITVGEESASYTYVGASLQMILQPAAGGPPSAVAHAGGAAGELSLSAGSTASYKVSFQSNGQAYVPKSIESDSENAAVLHANVEETWSTDGKGSITIQVNDQATGSSTFTYIVDGAYLNIVIYH